MSHVVVIGASGFVGRAVVGSARALGHHVQQVVAPRLTHVDVAASSTTSEVTDAAARWLESDDAATSVRNLAAMIEGADVVINAAGLATPDEPLSRELVGANTTLPALCALSAAVAGARSVHVSSASVQAQFPRIDETSSTAPNSPYSLSKASGEHLLRQLAPSCIIYRATSVQGAERQISQSLVRLVDLPVVPLARGKQPLPLSLIDNVADAIMHLANSDTASGIYLHPWEGIHTSNLIAALSGRARRLPVPATVGSGTIRALRRLSVDGKRSRLAGTANRLSLLLEGRPIDADRLAASGWPPPHDFDAYRSLAELVRHPLPESNENRP